MTDENNKVDAIITVVFKSGAVVYYNVKDTTDVLDKFLHLYRAALVDSEETVAKGRIGNVALVINLNDLSSIFVDIS